MEIIGYIASIFIGLILGLLGGGGSILSIPILVYLFNVSAVKASAYSLFIVGITSLIGAIPKYKDHLVDIRTGLTFGIPAVITIFSTRKWIIPAIPEIIWHGEYVIITKRIVLLGLLAILMILAAIIMIKGKDRKFNTKAESRFIVFALVLEGILIGLLTGLVGAGGGFLIIPALIYLTGLPFNTAVGTSLFIIAINSLSGFLGDFLNYSMDWKLLLSIATLAITGILIGNHFAKKISPRALRKVFGWFVLVMGCWILMKEFYLI